MSQASRSGRSSPSRRPTSTAGTAGLLSSLRATMSTHLRSAAADAAGESPSASIGSFQLVTGGGLGRAEASAGAARSLLGAFVSGAGPGSPDSQAFSAGEEEEIRFSTGGDIHSAFEKLALGGDDGDGGDGVGLFVLTDLEAHCLIEIRANSGDIEIHRRLML